MAVFHLIENKTSKLFQFQVYAVTGKFLVNIPEKMELQLIGPMFRASTTMYVAFNCESAYGIKNSSLPVRLFDYAGLKRPRATVQPKCYSWDNVIWNKGNSSDGR